MKKRASVFLLIFVIFFAIGRSLSAADSKTITLDEFRDKLKGGFVGQMVGVTYGAPFEFQYDGTMVPEERVGPWSPVVLQGAIAQDDIYVELTFLETIEKYGLDASMETFGKEFGKSKYPLWHANASGRENILAGVMPPLSGHPSRNSHADDIDFQIEADVFGLITPGMPASSQSLTWRVGHVMNYGDGVYGGVFIAAMYSAAYFENDPVKVVEAGLAAIPADSNYAKTVADVLDAYKKDPSDWRKAWQLIEDKWAPKGHCPTRNDKKPGFPFGIAANINGAYVVIALLYGNGDPMATMKIAVMSGRDNDCNTSSAMGVLGAMKGFKALPKNFSLALDSMKNSKFSFTDYTWRTALIAMEAQALKEVEKSGGSIVEAGGVKVLSIPNQQPEKLPLEQWPYGADGKDVPVSKY